MESYTVEYRLPGEAEAHAIPCDNLETALNLVRDLTATTPAVFVSMTFRRG